MRGRYERPIWGTLFQDFSQFLKLRSNLIDISQFTFHSVHPFCSTYRNLLLVADWGDQLAPSRETEARTLLVLLNTFSLVLLTAQKLAAVGQPEERWRGKIHGWLEEHHHRAFLSHGGIPKSP